MKNNYILSIDLGTTNCKTLLLDEKCRIVKSISREFPLSLPRPGWSEQDPELWWSSLTESMIELLEGINPQGISVIGLSGQMHGLVPLDNEKQVLRPAILWNDQRSAAECEQAYEAVGGKNVFRAEMNNSLLPGYTGGKILWLKNNEPEVFNKLRHVIMPKDFIRYRLCSHLGTDFSDASGTGFFDVLKNDWNRELISALNLPLTIFPECLNAGDIAGTLSSQAAEELGLPQGIPVTTGGGDAVMQTVGSNVLDETNVLTVFGTGGNVTLSTDNPVPNQEGLMQILCHVVQERWIALGVTVTAGSSFRWFRDTLGQPETLSTSHKDQSAYERLCSLAEQSQRGAKGLLFLPYLQGERCPHIDHTVRGTFLGLSLQTSKADIARAIMEGVSFSLKDAFQCITKTTAQPHEVCMSGGGADSLLWRQIQADIFNLPVKTMSHSGDASALGAGIIAGTTAGFWKKPSEVAGNIEITSVTYPDKVGSELYKNIFELYKQGYPALSDFYNQHYHISHLMEP